MQNGSTVNGSNFHAVVQGFRAGIGLNLLIFAGGSGTCHLVDVRSSSNSRIFSLAGRWPQFPSFSQPSESSKTIRLQVPHWKKKTKTNCKTVQKCAHPWISWIFNGIKWSIICAHHASWALSDDRHGQLHTLRSAASSAFANSSLASWTRQ